MGLLAACLALAVATAASAQTVAPGDGLRLWASSLNVRRFEAAYVGRYGDTLVLLDKDGVTMTLQAPAVTRLQVARGRDRLGGAKKGALWGVAFGGITASITNTSELANAVLIAGTYGAIIGAIVGKRAWKDVSPTILLTATPIAQQPADSARPTMGETRGRGAPLEPVGARRRRAPLPPGFLGQQLQEGARGGAIAGGIGAVAGIVFLIATRNQRSDDMNNLGLLAVPIGGFFGGYLIGAPIGVWRYSNSKGVRAPLPVALAGGAVGMLGFAAGGVPGFFTVPLGAAWLHNLARRPEPMRVP